MEFVFRCQWCWHFFSALLGRMRKIFHQSDEVSTVSGVGDEKSMRLVADLRKIFHQPDEVSTVPEVGDEKS